MTRITSSPSHNPRKTVAEIIDANGDGKINNAELLEYLVTNNADKTYLSVVTSTENKASNDGLGGIAEMRSNLREFYNLEATSGLKNLANHFDNFGKDEWKKEGCSSDLGMRNCTSTLHLNYLVNFILAGKDWLDLRKSADRKQLAKFMSVPK